MENTETKRVHLFHCDSLFNLDSVESLFTSEVRSKLNFNITIDQHHFKLSEMSKISDSTVPGLHMDLAVFVVHAHESRLSINEENAGIGYAKIYRALVQATGDNVIIVIGGDDNYKDDGEEDRVVLSRWSKRKISSQFNEEYLDGRKSFIFSWTKQHRKIHEEALLHYFDPSKKGQKFEYQPEPVPLPKPEELIYTPPAKDIKVEIGIENREASDTNVTAESGKVVTARGVTWRWLHAITKHCTIL